MTIKQFLTRHTPEKTVLLGYYGGGNYGDELLLEVMQNLLWQHGVKQADIGYMPYCAFATYHRDFGYRTFRANSPIQLLRAILRNKHVVVGGGGIWGLDTQLQPLLMSIALAIARWVFGKNVHLVGVGYYRSTNRLGHVGAWLAAKSATTIIARDAETRRNFSRFKKEVHQDTDLAWYLREVDPKAYASELANLERTLPIGQKTLLVTLRRFSPQHANDYTNIIREAVAKYSAQTNIVLALLEPSAIDQQNYQLIREWQRSYPNVRILDYTYNPVAFYLFLHKHRKNIALISPQFHAIISAYLQDVVFLPLTYDNKVRELYDQINIAKSYSIYDLQPQHVYGFIEDFYKVKA